MYDNLSLFSAIYLLSNYEWDLRLEGSVFLKMSIFILFEKIFPGNI